jgi:hypothetical protein
MCVQSHHVPDNTLNSTVELLACNVACAICYNLCLLKPDAANNTAAFPMLCSNLPSPTVAAAANHKARVQKALLAAARSLSS